jgi:hypothetical protein
MRGPYAKKPGGLFQDAGGRFRFSPDALRPVLERRQPDIEWMEARLGESLGEDLGQHQPGDVNDESDLLRPDPVVVAALFKLLGRAAPLGIRGDTPEDVALLVHALRREHAPNDPNMDTPAKRQADRVTLRHGRSPTAIGQLIDDMESQNPEALNGMARGEAQVLVRNLFRHISEALSNLERGELSYPGLGCFRVNRIEKFVESKKVVRTRISFRPAVPSAGKEPE